jgi:endonuclease-3
LDLSLLIARLKAAHPDAECALVHENPFQLLVATILSAQCTDERVNKVTPTLFRSYPDPDAMMAADPAKLEEIIRTTGFYRNKTRSIHGAARQIVENYQGAVPRTMEDLLMLPGVARKTANVVLGVGYGIAEGIVVDTHVYRVSHRLGLTKAGHPVQVEQDLMKLVPRSEWILFAHLLIFHGRRICLARKPRCGTCPVQDLCPSAPIFLSGKVPARERAMAAARAGANGAMRSTRKRAAGKKRPLRKKRVAKGKTARKKTVKEKSAKRKTAKGRTTKKPRRARKGTRT